MSYAWVWAVWGGVVLATFAILEGWALDHHSRDWTLSRTVTWLGRKYPITIFLLGIFFGGLFVHFYWRQILGW